MVEVEIRKETLQLLPERAIYWPSRSTVFIADLHFGKTNHFRKEGIPIPEMVRDVDYVKLNKLLVEQTPRTVFFLGDLFHSTMNLEWELLKKLVQDFPNVQFNLVIGNHDILSEQVYIEMGFELHKSDLELGPFLLTHEPQLENDSGLYNLSGHIHPGVAIRGKGRQSLRFPCFFFSDTYCILPAFGTFTGLKCLNGKKTDRIFPIVEDRIFEIGNT